MSEISWKDYEASLGALLKSKLNQSQECPMPWNIYADSREDLSGKWFMPLVGENFDGHHFIEEALTKKGALGSFCSESFYNKIPQNLHNKLIVVTDTLVCLQKIAHMNRLKNPGVKVFAITGSVGKTTCKNMLKDIIKASGINFLYAKKNFNNEYGLPFTLLKLKPKHKAVILEMGARKPGNIKELISIAEPNYVACLNVGYSHIEIFGSRENIYLTKTEIFEKTKFYQKGIVYADDPKLVLLAKASDPSCLTFGRKPSLDAEILRVKPGIEKTEVSLRLLDKNVTFKMKSYHEAYAINALAASLLALCSGTSLDSIKKGLEAFIPPDSRFQTHHYKDKIIIDDCYNASPESMRAGIQTVNKLYPDKSISYILGDMLEFGNQSEKFHQDLGEFCSKHPNLNKLLAVGSKSQVTLQSAVKAGIPKECTEHFSSVDKLIEKNLPLSYFGDVIYIKGSSGIKLTNYLKCLLKK